MTDPQRTTPQLIEDIQALITEIQQLYCHDEIPWIIGYSGGKDSTTTLQLVWQALQQLPTERRTKQVYVITTDTRVENPIVATWVKRSIANMQTAAIEQGLPIESHLLFPDVKDTFWVNLIGKGYPAPRNGFRWCTERLKIKPSNQFVQNIVRAKGEVIIVLGTRKAESTRRSRSMSDHEIGSIGDRIGDSTLTSWLYHGSLPNSLIYSPIADWRNDEVWLYLHQYPNPWGNSNKDLFTMYRGATADNECPLVLDSSTPSCGDSRFGCWVCTLVNKDKSMEAMIQNDDEKEWMQPLLELRNALDNPDDWDKRDFRRMSGNVQLFTHNNDGKQEVKPIPGPYTKKWREHWLRELLKAQTLARKNAPPEMQAIELITQAELSEIRRIWREDKHEFDDALPRIYLKETGEKFQDINSNDSQSLLGADEWEILANLCGENAMHLELTTKLLSVERQHYGKMRRVGIYEALEKCFETSSRSQEEALENAHRFKDLKDAAQEGDVDKVRQLALGEVQKSAEPETSPKASNWASMKFGAPVAPSEVKS
ncbi:Phosphoadenosine phosphosulphate reductase domain-containing protein [Tumidithrix helvetica PCC 7403]|uniref:DNA phosphorothioation system sulfurtransferase DndC n=1 Tax=Tumidithrix helvetica TaxID=3457545 RepID=UPI003CA0E7D4